MEFGYSPPEPEPEDARVLALVEVLGCRDDPREPLLVLGQVGQGGQEPAVTQLPLVDVEPVDLAGEHDRVLANLLNDTKN